MIVELPGPMATWRVGKAESALATVAAVGVPVGLATAYWASARSFTEVLIALVFLCPATIAWWLLAVRPKAIVFVDRLEVINPHRRHTVLISEVVAVVSDGRHPRVWRTDGSSMTVRSISCWTGPIMGRLLSRRGNDFAALIESLCDDRREVAVSYATRARPSRWSWVVWTVAAHAVISGMIGYLVQDVTFAVGMLGACLTLDAVVVCDSVRDAP